MPRPSHTIDQRLRDKLRPIARQMRREPTPAEALLWTHLRNRQLCGYHFHRQHQIDRFIVDFVCLQSKLVIEVDGAIHQQQVEADLEREQILKSLGYRSIRFTNDQVLDETDQVLEKILASLP